MPNLMAMAARKPAGEQRPDPNPGATHGNPHHRPDADECRDRDPDPKRLVNATERPFGPRLRGRRICRDQRRPPDRARPKKGRPALAAGLRIGDGRRTRARRSGEDEIGDTAAWMSEQRDRVCEVVGERRRQRHSPGRRQVWSVGIARTNQPCRTSQPEEVHESDRSRA